MRLAFADPPRSVRATSRDGSVQLTLPDDRTAYHVTVSTKDGSSDVTVPTDSTAPRRITASTSDGDVDDRARGLSRGVISLSAPASSSGP